ncbi:AIPR protein [Clostridium sporogenes]|uniref:AIPR family protein n=1 Tax=Clostridium sporogenes TaxID=1509 RepID=UPI0013D2A742|nr:AIPR family protein [Clostridium sporogenes]NFF65904.1 AIPR protein [Clostridium sporogenes]NFF98293.1 AIPR protein [Clostridium sporogenes]NFG05371.1 AIPR protein [Clostridium sporogenes]NFG50958.1 AIPR protein [Clostridium sporogenes]NFP83210.1 AIPR protein [Clostridium sporogenes]
MKYKLLENILDRICKEAPKEMKSYKIDDNDHDKLIKARSKAFIHLYLKVKFGISEFKEREKYITDGSQDGGLDAYYIDRDNKYVYLIQSKFRANGKNFEYKEIDLDELVKMEIEEIINGEDIDSNESKFNSKVQNFQKQLSCIEDIARYKYRVIILANLTKYNDKQIKKLICNMNYEIFNFEKTYNELVYPMCTSTYYNGQKIELIINLDQKNIEELTEGFNTSIGECEVSIVFVPIKEIGKAMDKYKNTILKYNPRNYLSISKNNVNKKIKDSVIDNNVNDFALLNNGITILCDEYSSTTKTGKKNKSQIVITNPQFINGGQTAYTLSKIFRSKNIDDLENKKVMLKVITIENDDDLNNSDRYLTFIQKISDATNMQTKVEEADRRSNEIVQIEIQKNIYSQYGYLYERKNGEFETAVSEKYISKDIIIDRNIMARSYSAFQGKAAFARGRSGDKIFKRDVFMDIFKNSEEYKEMFLSYIIFEKLSELDRMHRKNLYNSKLWGNALRYGKYAVVAAIGVIKNDLYSFHNLDKCEDVMNLAEKFVNLVLNKWIEFEQYAKTKDTNKKYFNNVSKEFDNYYKGSTIDIDLSNFFSEEKEIVMKEVCSDQT